MAIFDKYSEFLREEDRRKLEIGKIDWESRLITICMIIKDSINAIRDETHGKEDDECDSESVIKLKERLADARKELADLLNLMGDHDFCSHIENVANEVKYWEEYELTAEEKKQNDKILEDNRIIIRARNLDGWFVEPQLSELRKQAEGLEYKEPFPMQYPWSGIAQSMLESPRGVIFDYDNCPYCGQSRISVFFSSPRWTWNNLMGKSGRISICMNCRRQGGLEIWMRN